MKYLSYFGVSLLFISLWFSWGFDFEKPLINGALFPATVNQHSGFVNRGFSLIFLLVLMSLFLPLIFLLSKNTKKFRQYAFNISILTLVICLLTIIYAVLFWDKWGNAWLSVGGIQTAWTGPLLALVALLILIYSTFKELKN